MSIHKVKRPVVVIPEVKFEYLKARHVSKGEGELYKQNTNRNIT